MTSIFSQQKSVFNEINWNGINSKSKNFLTLSFQIPEST